MFVAAVLLGCGPGQGPGGDCADPVVAEACDLEICGPPVLRAATGDGPGRFRESPAEGPIPFVYASGNVGGGGYHVALALETENLCPVIFVAGRLLVEPDGADPVEVASVDVHVQAPGCEQLANLGAVGLTQDLCEESPSLQRWWGAELRILCPWWPDDPSPDRPHTCGEEPLGRIDQVEVIYELEVRDHDDRTATATVRGQAVLELE